MFIYVISARDGTGPQKIGYSQDVEKRLFSIQTGNPVKLKIHHKQEIPDDRAKLLEKQIHKEIRHKKISGEWFDITPNDAKLEIDFALIRWLDDPLLGKL